MHISRKQVAEQQAEREEWSADEQTDASLLHEALEFQLIQARTVAEVVMHRLLDQPPRLFLCGKLLTIDNQLNRLMPMKFLRPTDDEFLRVMVQVLLMERRRIHRVEELADIAQTQFDTMRRPFLACVDGFG